MTRTGMQPTQLGEHMKTFVVTSEDKEQPPYEVEADYFHVTIVGGRMYASFYLSSGAWAWKSNELISVFADVCEVVRVK